jgi:hypothetical protein
MSCQVGSDIIRKYAGAPLKDIGSRFGINSYSSVGSVIMRIKLAMNKDKQLRQRITAAEKLLTWAMKRPLRLTAQVIRVYSTIGAEP